MDAEQIYQDSLNYLYSFVDYSLTRGGFAQMAAAQGAGAFDLDRMRQFMHQLGDPQRSYPILHVAGTKGKGSVCTLCAAALQAAGYRVGLYTSPHLQDYAERIQVAGQPIGHAELVALVDEFRPYLDQGTKLTTFEITTALAMLYFARQGCTAVVLEVGLGGRLDATNIVTPLVSVITSLSYDHMAVLGNTLAEIATEKAGIIKPGVPVVLAPQMDEARQAVERIAAQRQAPLFPVRSHDLVQAGEGAPVDAAFGFAAQGGDLSGQDLQVWGPADSQPHQLRIRLLGLHQVENAAVAYAALRVAGERGLTVPWEAIRTGFARAAWPGRFEVLQARPPVVVDSAHNRDSAIKLRQALAEYFPNQRVIMIYGASEDKDIRGMFAELLPVVEQVIVTRSFHPRAADPQVLSELAAQHGKQITVIPAVEDALDEALRRLDETRLVLATGSIFIAAAVRESWYNQMK